MDVDTFEHLVGEVLDSLPDEFLQHLENVEIMVAKRPTREQQRNFGLHPDETVYGLYEGVPLTECDALDFGMPATIIIFQEPLERDFSDVQALRDEVRRTVLHEVAHHFGISDDRLHELGAY